MENPQIENSVRGRSRDMARSKPASPKSRSQSRSACRSTGDSQRQQKRSSASQERSQKPTQPDGKDRRSTTQPERPLPSGHNPFIPPPRPMPAQHRQRDSAQPHTQQHQSHADTRQFNRQTRRPASADGRKQNSSEMANSFRRSLNAHSKQRALGRTGFTNADADRQYRKWTREHRLICYGVVAATDEALDFILFESKKAGVTMYEDSRFKPFLKATGYRSCGHVVGRKKFFLLKDDHEEVTTFLTTLGYKRSAHSKAGFRPADLEFEFKANSTWHKGVSELCNSGGTVWSFLHGLDFIKESEEGTYMLIAAKVTDWVVQSLICRGYTTLEQAHALGFEVRRLPVESAGEFSSLHAYRFVISNEAPVSLREHWISQGWQLAI